MTQTMKVLRVAALLMSTCCAVGPVAAQEHTEIEIPVHKQSGINYVTGGVTEEERHAMGKIANRYPMQLVFSEHGARDVKGVQIAVKDLRGSTLIEAVSDGPYFFFNPPSGRWTMEARLEGETITRTVDLVGRRYIYLEFKFGEPAQ